MYYIGPLCIRATLIICTCKLQYRVQFCDGDYLRRLGVAEMRLLVEIERLSNINSCTAIISTGYRHVLSKI